jgi:O-antigen ligase
VTTDADGSAWPVRAACLYAALTPFQPVVPLPDGSVLRIAAAEPIAPLLLLAAVVRPRRGVAPGLGILALGIAVTALFSTLLALGERNLTGYTAGKTAGLLYMIAVAVAIARALPPGTETRMLRALATGTFWSAVIGIGGFLLWMAGYPTELMDVDRLCATMPGDPNIYGGLVAVALIITAADRRPTRLPRLAVLSVALVLTASRSAFAGLAGGAAAYALLRSRDPWLTLAKGVVAGIAAALAVGLVLRTDTGQRVSDAGWDHVSRTFTIESRFDLYDRAIEQFAEHPLVGLGVGGFHDSI